VAVIECSVYYSKVAYAGLMSQRRSSQTN